LRLRRRAAHRRAVIRRRRAVAGLLAVVVLVVTIVAIAGGGGSDGEGESRPPAQAERPAELPRGGRSILPEYRVVAFYGAPQSDELGALGIGTPAQAARRLARTAGAAGACCRRSS
jgi:hypothetical protein